MKHTLAILMFLSLFFGSVSHAVEAKKPASKSFQAEARAAAARMGFPGYPDPSQDTFVVGALWAHNRKAAKAHAAAPAPSVDDQADAWHEDTKDDEIGELFED